MAQVSPALSTGLPGLDHVLRGLIPGDNVVWEVRDVEDYRPFVTPYVEASRRLGQPLVYFRFARHEPLVGPEAGARVVALDPQAGFEAFLSGIHRTIEETGHGGYYVFDCLSDLAVDWYSDQMLGNFFRLTCPYLFDVQALAYFAVLRHYHAGEAVEAISGTTQIFLDVYRHDGRLYLHPVKVQQRYSPTMYMLHEWDEASGAFTPVKQSAETSEVLTSDPGTGPGSDALRIGLWGRTFVQAEEVLAEAVDPESSTPKAGRLRERLLRMAVSRDEPVLALAEKYLTLEDVVAVRKRMIGTGLIGGKTVGMLLARAILRASDPKWAARLEPHDSYYVGSDVFYTFLVENGIWWVRERQKDPQTFLDGSERARHRMLTGEFPPAIVDQFERMLDYFGQSPIIVRSSSLLEDNFGNSFAGKYESVFCANQGSRDKRLEDFLSAVRTIYASAMSERALRYRAARGLLDQDEQMALLVQRVSGALYGTLFYPPVAGVGFSFNPYVWDERIDPDSGVLRIVLGLGTRAVDRSDDDYTRVVAMNAPDLRPESNVDQARQYAQRKVDVLDLEANQLVSARLADVARRSPELPLELLATRDEALARRAAEGGVADVFPWVLTFERLFGETDYVADMRDMLATLQAAYDYPVDVEFTTNATADGRYRINLVQCRPLQVQSAEGRPTEAPPEDLPEADVVLEARGAVIGPSRAGTVDRLIFVDPAVYGELAIGDRYSVARLIGRLVHVPSRGPAPVVLLVGPGRWGTTTPSLGVPVSFADINAASAVCEVVAMRDDLVPDVSLGTHFLNELVEMDVLYCALFPGREGNRLNADLLRAAPDRRPELTDEGGDWVRAVRVIDGEALEDGARLVLHADTRKQRVLCYLERVGESGE